MTPTAFKSADGRDLAASLAELERKYGAGNVVAYSMGEAIYDLWLATEAGEYFIGQGREVKSK